MSAADEVAELEPTFGKAVAAWLTELRQTGTPQVYILSGRRSNEEQWALRVQNCPDPANSPSGACSPPTAPVGASAHNRGEAVDIAPASAYAAAGALAGKYGLAATVGGEPWHFELVDGSRAPQSLIGDVAGTVGDIAGSVAGGLAGATGLGAFAPVLGWVTSPGWWRRTGLGTAGVLAVLLAVYVLAGDNLAQAGSRLTGAVTAARTKAPAGGSSN